MAMASARSSWACALNAIASATAPNIVAWYVFMFVLLLLALDSRALVQVPVGVYAHIGQKVRDGLGHVSRLGKALLAETVVHAPLQRVHLAAGHAIAGPALEAAHGIRLGGKIRQVLRADAQVILAVTTGASEIVRAG